MPFSVCWVAPEVFDNAGLAGSWGRERQVGTLENMKISKATLLFQKVETHVLFLALPVDLLRPTGWPGPPLYFSVLN